MENDCALRCWEGNGVQLCQSTRHGNDIARTIVGIGVGGVPRCAEQLALVVVGVGNGALPGSGKGCDVTHAVIGIAILLPAAQQDRR